MSTRAEVRIIEGEKSESPRVTYLYHHSDGYPSYMVPALQRAYKRFVEARADRYGLIKFRVAGEEAHVSRWQGGRAGYAATFIAAADLGLDAVEPADEQNNHGDLDFYYTVWVKEGGRDYEKHQDLPAEWDVEIRYSNENGRIVTPRTPIRKLKPVAA